MRHTEHDGTSTVVRVEQSHLDFIPRLQFQDSWCLKWNRLLRKRNSMSKKVSKCPLSRR